MKHLLTCIAIILFYCGQSQQDTTKFDYKNFGARKPSENFYSKENRVLAKDTLRKEYGKIFGLGDNVIGSGISSEFDEKESKISGQVFMNGFYFHSENPTGFKKKVNNSMLAFSSKVDASTDGSFYTLKAQERPTVGISGGIFWLFQPRRWNYNTYETFKKHARPDSKRTYSNRSPSSSSYKWLNVTGGYNNGSIKFANLDSIKIQTYTDTTSTWNCGISWNYFRSYNKEEYTFNSVNTWYTSTTLSFSRTDNLKDLDTYSVVTEKSVYDSETSTTTTFTEDKGKHYGVTTKKPFQYAYDWIISERVLISPVSGLVLSFAGNLHYPTKTSDDPETPLVNEKRKSYAGFESGIHFYAKNAAGIAVANFGIYADYNYSSKKDALLFSFKTSLPIKL